MRECAEIPPESYSGRVISMGEWVGSEREGNKVVIRNFEWIHCELRSGAAPGEDKV